MPDKEATKEKALEILSSNGEETTEYEQAKSSGTWGIVAMILGAVISFGPTVLDALGASLGDASPFVVIGGAIIAFAGILQKTFSDLGYISSRTQTKRALAHYLEEADKGTDNRSTGS